MSENEATPVGKVAPEDRRIGVYICHCGGNISDYVDVEAVREALADEPGVVVSTTELFACSDGTQHDMIDAIKEKQLDGLVVASCSPKLHQVTFRNVAARAGMNPYTYSQVNVREQGSWAHQHDKAGATEKVIGLVRSSVAKTRLSDALEPLRFDTVPRALVVGGGIAGLRAAIGLAEIGLEAVVVEKAPEVGGWVGRHGETFPSNAAGRDQIASLTEQIKQRRDITVYTNAELTGKSGTFGNYSAEITLHREGGDKTLSVDVGSIIVATGFDSYAPDDGEFGYGIDGVVTLPQFKELVDASEVGKLTYNGRPVRSVGYVYCVGSRQEAGGNEYCSKFCCTAAIHASVLVNKLDPGIRQFHLYRDVRAYGRNELLYNETRDAGSVFLKFADDAPPTVAKLPSGGLGLTITDLLTDSREVTIPVDLVVLVTGMVPRQNKSLVDLLKLPLGTDGFFNEIHPKLRPVETVVDGVMIAGCCQSPRTAGESVAAGLAAVAQSAALLKKGYAELEPLVARIDPEKCTGSGDCLTACPYDSITSIEWDGRQIASVDPATCKGCGGCIPVCGADAIDLLGYTDAQMRAAIEEMFEASVPVKEPVA
ncbi:CoB--CoM heterodisulfide reductase iron-sulfur subunit A family protein [Propionicimonas sp.]|uniref:CoB--CoM heterodisulfide reductase iron-sulfur subunit A family protein n=1 Tax=Propionicimonas sp. TaxID=1955623 RepID=UPI0017C51351|nr:CoB--CoM heterodisulfide reductase iron-sulfur subunit A family protein [Propionicimonas sp.]MBU3976232.1 CoB--CoM heterodisulfide reductase iron-sulfur subunit A family protein [Actinomycetota bacterium]MBA3021044.1 CoB--CoM heterodisulfide reductase iron-sulfur subunit A family protein [Propionicimonas sp.]MBU3985627.1 CoB--CoM heterodisulfide reductase iron-sulfur subunit A family protein [Actinomycetota bacterium]MBU4008412.1 CoB--CoM heterodisulfide reductase iron-sulfur subunit A famil